MLSAQEICKDVDVADVRVGGEVGVAGMPDDVRLCENR
jgi:hypothetical protein